MTLWAYGLEHQRLLLETLEANLIKADKREIKIKNKIKIKNQARESLSEKKKWNEKKKACTCTNWKLMRDIVRYIVGRESLKQIGAA